MSNENYLREVREQYENYPYPMVNPDDEKKRIIIPIIEAFDCLNHYCFSGKRDFRKPFRALIAGGGTGDATTALAEQFRDYDDAEIVYVDMSTSSMAIAQERARIRGLTNITWIRDSLLNIPKLGLGEFDYINSSGVLHHLANPSEGLQILSDALKPDGAMGIMLYAKYGRTAVYQMQETLRIINKNEPNLQKRVDNAKTILNFLPETNWFNHSPPAVIQEVRSGDIGIYDLLLHSQDCAYSIPELYDFMGKANLKILHFFPDDRILGPNLYDPIFYIKDAALAAHVQALPLREKQALAELLNGKIIKHTFYAAKTIPAPASPEDLDNIPVMGFDIFSEHKGICELINKAEGVVIIRQIATNVEIILPKTPHMEIIFKYIDGKTTLKEIFRKIMDSPLNKKEKPNFQTLSFEFEAMYGILNARNWLFLRHKSTSPIVYPDTMLERIKSLHSIS